MALPAHVQKKIVERLLGEYPDCPEPPEEAIEWQESEIKDFFESGGKLVPLMAKLELGKEKGTAPVGASGTPTPAQSLNKGFEAAPPPKPKPGQPPPRTDGKLRCQRIGCDALYTEDNNPSGACRYHPGPPVFHDGGKTWGCCNAKSHDFGTFMSLPGCRVGAHSQEKPAAPAQSPNVTAAPPPLPPTIAQKKLQAKAGAEDCPRCKQGFFCSEHATGSGPVVVAPPKPKPKAAPAGPDDVQTCRHKGCGEKFTERANHDKACHFHPGPPIFHERQKGWACCNVVKFDFDDFLKIPPCAVGRHSADENDGPEYGKTR